MLTCRYPKESGARPTLAVHPHVRGESETKRGGDTIYQGSPPRTWGKRSSIASSSSYSGFTPTHVGKALTAKK